MAIKTYFMICFSFIIEKFDFPGTLDGTIAISEGGVLLLLLMCRYFDLLYFISSANETPYLKKDKKCAYVLNAFESL